MTIYKYGFMAWIWRGLITFGLVLAAGFLALSVASPFLLIGAIAIAAPAVFFGVTLVVRADLVEGRTLLIQTLLFYRRRIDRAQLGAPKARRRYTSEMVDFDAPRGWVPVKDGWPLYFDLLGQIPDRRAFLQAIGVSESALRNAK